MLIGSSPIPEVGEGAAILMKDFLADSAIIRLLIRRESSPRTRSHFDLCRLPLANRRESLVVELRGGPTQVACGIMERESFSLMAAKSAMGKSYQMLR